MTRVLAAILLVSSASAWAQAPQVADDQKRLQGIWRVREVLGSDEAKAYMLQMHLAFRGNKPLPVTKGEPSSEFSYALDPSKEPKQIELIARMAILGEKGPVRERVVIAGIYAFEHDRLKLRYGQWLVGRPADFSMDRRWGTFDCVLILERDASPAARAKVQDARAIMAIEELGGDVHFSDKDSNPLGAGPPLFVKLDEQGDAILTRIAPQLKALSSISGLHLQRSKVTDAGLASLEGINNIAQINLERTAITDAGLTHLRNMTHLGALIVSETNVTSAGVASLKKSLPHLQVTRLSQAESLSLLAITNAGGAESFDDDGKPIEIRFTRGLNDFQLLGLQQHLEVWKSTLRTVDLTDCHVTDRGLAALGGLTSLERLTLKGTDVTVAGVKSLRRTVPNLKVKH